MSGLNGISLSKRIFEIRPDIPVILNTGNSNDLLEEEWREIGIREMLIKPVSPNVLLKTIRKAVNGD